MDKNSFLDIRNHGFARVAVVIPRVHVANPHANVQEHLAELKKVYDKGAQYALCPELGITGYTCGDLFHSEELLGATTDALTKLLRATEAWPMLISVGAPLVFGSSLYNCAITMYRGKIVAIAPKSYLPEYREFYEMRHFAPARSLPFNEMKMPKQDEKIPIGTDILIELEDVPGFILHTDVCEDIWVPIPPGTQAALAGATVLANLSASNITVGKSDYRTDLVVASSGRNNAVQMYGAAGYGESTTDHAWDGQGFIAERGNLLKASERFALDGTHIFRDVALKSLTLERMRQGSFRENASDYPKTFRRVGIPRDQDERLKKIFTYLERTVDPHPFVPNEKAKRDERCYEVFNIQATSLARRLEALPENSRRIFIGISGGQDSTHALLVAVHTMDMLKMSRTQVFAVTMPGFGTSDRTYHNACNLAKALGVSFLEIPIKEIAAEMFKAISYDPKLRGLPYENVQAWMRTQTLFASACAQGGIVLGTGDLSELLIGWCTYGGDHLSHYGINAGVPKTLITFLIRWTSEVIFKNEPDVQKVLDDIVETPISPELLPTKEGVIAQKSEEKNGPYELIDFFGYYFVRFGFEPARIARMCLEAFGARYSIAEIKKWLKKFFTMFFANQFKRSCIPDGPKVGLTCVSPRGDWRMPSDIKPDIWLKKIEEIPDTME